MENNTSRIILIISLIAVNLMVITITGMSVINSAKKVMNNEISSSGSGDKSDIYGESSIDSNNKSIEKEDVEYELFEGDTEEKDFQIGDILKRIVFTKSEIIKIVLILVGLNLFILGLTIFIKMKKNN